MWPVAPGRDVRSAALMRVLRAVKPPGRLASILPGRRAASNIARSSPSGALHWRLFRPWPGGQPRPPISGALTGLTYPPRKSRPVYESSKSRKGSLSPACRVDSGRRQRPLVRNQHRLTIDIANDRKGVHGPRIAKNKIQGELYAIEVVQVIFAGVICPVRSGNVAAAGRIRPGQ